IGHHFGGLVSISSQTLNLLDCSEARIEVKRNFCGFIPAEIVVTDKIHGNFALRFGDISSLDPSCFIPMDLSLSDFDNEIDLKRVSQVLMDEGFSSSQEDLNSFNDQVLNFPALQTRVNQENFPSSKAPNDMINDSLETLNDGGLNLEKLLTNSIIKHSQMFFR
ncbi:MAG: hypothetical protein Q8754_03055, partial [Sweet potato little leaf phytoplasma]|nr:hypothetical protein [Sweet potato little leaf phytoplasma]